jgi:PKD repeat protein
MKYLFFGLLAGLSCFDLFSQETHCISTEVTNEWFNLHPELKAGFDQLQKAAVTQDSLDVANGSQKLKKPAVPTYTIPVVFHVLHQNGPENISDAQIMDAVSILNRDFRKLNPDTSTIVSQFKNLAADVNFEFALATIDPNGFCTNGIVRYYDPHTDWDPSAFSYFNHTWPRSMYLNIYIVRSIAGGNAAAYTFLPGSVPANMDAVVAIHYYTGSIGTSNPYTSRTLTHEVGHWFNLQHLWGSTNNSQISCGDDGVSDTPITKGFGWCGNTTPSVCNPPIVENIQNYMDYAYCSRMFTIGQATRMNNSINSGAGQRVNLWSASNLSLTGVVNPSGPCAPKADFFSAKKVICKGASIQFYDLSYNGTVNTWQWEFKNATPTVSNLQNPTTAFYSSGTKSVELKVSNATGSDSITKSVVQVLAGPGSGTTSIAQSFESISFPDSNWVANIPGYGSPWQHLSGTGSTGTKCIYVNNYFDTPNEPVFFYSPMFDLNTVGSPVLSFNVAYSQNPSKSKDRLRVYSSVDCGNTWIVIYSKRDSALHTFGQNIYATGSFTAPLPIHWRKEYVNLASISTASNALFQFEFSPDSLNPGNNILIDDINIESSVGMDHHSKSENFVNLFPNPTSERSYLNFTLAKTSSVAVEAFDVSGKRLFYQSPVLMAQGKQELSLDLSGLAQGLYFLKLKIDTEIVVKKLLVE